MVYSTVEDNLGEVGVMEGHAYQGNQVEVEAFRQAIKYFEVLRARRFNRAFCMRCFELHLNILLHFDHDF